MALVSGVVLLSSQEMTDASPSLKPKEAFIHEGAVPLAPQEALVREEAFVSAMSSLNNRTDLTLTGCMEGILGSTPRPLM